MGGNLCMHTAASCLCLQLCRQEVCTVWTSLPTFIKLLALALLGLNWNSSKRRRLDSWLGDVCDRWQRRQLACVQVAARHSTTPMCAREFESFRTYTKRALAFRRLRLLIDAGLRRCLIATLKRLRLVARKMPAHGFNPLLPAALRISIL